MKHIKIIIEDWEHKEILKAKKGMTWKDLLLKKIDKSKDNQ